MKSTTAVSMVDIYKEQLMDARTELTNARTLKQLKFVQDKIAFLSQQISRVEAGRAKGFKRV